jgi:hypothetical protein
MISRWRPAKAATGLRQCAKGWGDHPKSPKLAVVAYVADGGDFTAKLQRATARSGMTKIIEHRPPGRTMPQDPPKLNTDVGGALAGAPDASLFLPYFFPGGLYDLRSLAAVWRT